MRASQIPKKLRNPPARERCVCTDDSEAAGSLVAGDYIGVSGSCGRAERRDSESRGRNVHGVCVSPTTLVGPTHLDYIGGFGAAPRLGVERVLRLPSRPRAMSTDDWVTHHKIHRGKGGNHALDNLELLCSWPCHSLKHPEKRKPPRDPSLLDLF